MTYRQRYPTWAQTIRKRRMAHFWALLATLQQDQIEILDLGGVGAFWDDHGITAFPQVHVTAVNLEPHPPISSQVTAMVGDARSFIMQLEHDVDIVFSNS